MNGSNETMSSMMSATSVPPATTLRTLRVARTVSLEPADPELLTIEFECHRHDVGLPAW